MEKALKLRQRLDLFLNPTGDLLCYFRQVTYFIKMIHSSLMYNRHWIINTSEAVSNVVGGYKRSHVNIWETDFFLPHFSFSSRLIFFSEGNYNYGSFMSLIMWMVIQIFRIHIKIFPFICLHWNMCRNNTYEQQLSADFNEKSKPSKTK